MIGIDRLTLVNFRAFPGHEPVTLLLSGKNLLIYGENGSGKTSIFVALAELFRHPAPRTGSAHQPPATPWENVFGGATAGPWSVALKFTNGKDAVWTARGVTGTGLELRNEAALMAATLDYRALLDTNYRHDDGDVNLFEILVTRLLATCGLASPAVLPFPVGVAQVRVSEFWDRLKALRISIGSNAKSVPANVLTACATFNNGLNTLLESLGIEANVLLQSLGHPGLTLEPLSLAGVTPVANFYREKRAYSGTSIPLRLSFRGYEVGRPQLFLNEARLTAIGLALYLAARKVVIAQSNLNAPKVLVLDDVLIGLDQANRIPVLDMLQQHFDDWQIVLLTHDRAFYEIGKQRLRAARWLHQEIYAGQVGNFEKPLLVEDDGDLYRALVYLERGEVKAAAVHVRSAFELVLKDACFKLHIPVKYHHDIRKISASEFWGAVKSAEYSIFVKPKFCMVKGKLRWWLPTQKKVKVVSPALTERIDHGVSWVLNPLSHTEAVDRYRREIEDAIFAVDELATAIDRALAVVQTRPAELLQYLASVLRARAVQLEEGAVDA